MKEKAEKFLFGDWHGFSYVLDIAVDIIGKTFTMIGVIAVVATLNPLIVMIFVVLVLLSSLFESRIQKKQAKMRLEMTVLNRRTMYYGQIIEDFSYGKELRLNNLGSWLMSREKEHWDYGFNLYKKNNQLNIHSGVFNAFTGFIQQIVSYAYLVVQVLAKTITIGDFTMYVGGVAAFSGAMRGLMQNIIEVSVYRNYYDAIEEYLDIPAKMRDNKRLPVPNGEHEIEFRNVSFSYPGQQDYALKNITI